MALRACEAICIYWICEEFGVCDDWYGLVCGSASGLCCETGCEIVREEICGFFCYCVYAFNWL
jgi:hypothetical protein